MSLSSGPGHYGQVRVLVVEDQKVLADRIAEGLRDQGMAVDVAYDGEAAMEVTRVHRAMTSSCSTATCPGCTATPCARALVAGPATARILMLTAAAAVEDRVDGLNLGADDYLAKPFAFAELVARVRVAGPARPSAPPVVVRGRPRRRPGPARGSAGPGGRSPLTRKEFGVLEVLVAADGGVVSAEELLDKVWDVHADPFSNTVSVTVSRLRRKLGGPPLIETVIGSGYRLTWVRA